MVESVTMTTREGSATITADDARKAIRVIDRVTGEIKGRPQQGALAGMDSVDWERIYRVRVTVISEKIVKCADESEAAQVGVDAIDSGDGEVIRRSVAVTYVRPKD